MKWDDQVKGLFVQVTVGGDKSFHLRYKIGGRYRKGKIGVYRTANAKKTQTSLATAREDAANKLSLASKDIDPFAERKREIEQEKADTRAKAARKTFALLANDYLEIYSKPNKKSWEEDQRILNVDVIPFIGDVALEDIRKSACSDIINTIMKRGSPGSADHCFKTMRAVFNWAVRNAYGDLEFSPMSGMKAPAPPKPRERSLLEEEVRFVWNWMETGSMHELTRHVFKLLLVTRQRPIDVCTMEKADVTIFHGRPIWTIPGERYKNGMTHIVPLSDLAIDILEDVERVKKDLDYVNVKTYNPRDGVCHHSGKELVFSSRHNLMENVSIKYRSERCRSDRAVALRKVGREPRYINSPYVFQSEKRLNTPMGSRSLPHVVDRERRNGGLLAAMEHWTPQDLRKMCGTHIRGVLKETQETIDKVLGHKDRSIGVTYNRYAYLAEKWRALDGWALELRRIWSGGA